MELIGYARVVPDPNAEEALLHQKARIEGFCKQSDHDLVKFFQEQINGDAVISERAQLQAAVKELNANRALVVVRLEKISGNKKVLQEVFHACQQKGSKIIVVHGPETIEQMSSTLQVSAKPMTSN